MGQILDRRVVHRGQRQPELSQREMLLVVEIGKDEIDTASCFVNYISEEYGLSKSSIWYNLKALKDHKVLDFATKDEVGKPLKLTREGLGLLDGLERDRNSIELRFANYAPIANGIGAVVGRVASAHAYGRVV